MFLLSPTRVRAPTLSLSLLSSTHVINFNFGRISVKFGQPIHLKDYVENHVATVRAAPATAAYDPYRNAVDRKKLNRTLADRVRSCSARLAR
jgi:glycerol-3-phosphate O-acyltransferase